MLQAYGPTQNPFTYGQIKYWYPKLANIEQKSNYTKCNLHFKHKKKKNAAGGYRKKKKKMASHLHQTNRALKKQASSAFMVCHLLKSIRRSKHI